MTAIWPALTVPRVVFVTRGDGPVFFPSARNMSSKRLFMSSAELPRPT